MNTLIFWWIEHLIWFGCGLIWGWILFSKSKGEVKE